MTIIHSSPFLRSLFALLLLSFTITASAEPGKIDSVAKMSSLGVYQGYSYPSYKGFKHESFYVPMRDSIRLAVDVFMPKKRAKGEKVPTVMYLTRYVRSLKAKFPFNLLKDPVLGQISEEEIKFLTSYGYACVIIDARGSGASEGAREMEFSPDEVKDAAEVIDWVIAQEWSDGQVATTGVSYVGTTAELILANKHPAVKACIPRSNIFDLYAHIMFPGGMRQGPFIKVWGYTTNQLDLNEFGFVGKKGKLVRGINPVDGDKKKTIYKQVMLNHLDNFDVYDGLLKANYRDDTHPDLNNQVPDDFSIHNYVKEVSESGTPFYRIGGWYDGSLQKSVIDGYLNIPNTERVLLGPWDHGPKDNASPWAATKDRNFSILNEILRFLDYHLKGIENGINEEEPFHYYTVGEGAWKTTNKWPLPEKTNTTLYLNTDQVLDDSRNTTGKLEYKIDYSATTGPSAGWNSVTPLYKTGRTNYPNRVEETKKLLNFTTPAFEQDVVMTGHPLADIYMSADAGDAGLFVYLEDVGPNDTVRFVTQGMLRATHRKIDETPLYTTTTPARSFEREDALGMDEGEVVRMYFDLLPISYQFKKGHKLRISIGGNDDGHFDRIEDSPSQLTIHMTEKYPSQVIIPFVKPAPSN